MKQKEPHRFQAGETSGRRDDLTPSGKTHEPHILIKVYKYMHGSVNRHLLTNVFLGECFYIRGR